MTVYAEQTGTYTPDQLVADDSGLITAEEVITGGAALSRGAVLGRVTANKRLMLSASAAGDGSQVPDAILAEDVDATDGDKRAAVYKAGMFCESQLILGAGHSIASIRQGLRERGIHIHHDV